MIEDDKRVEDVERWVVKYPRQDDVLEVLKAICLVHLNTDGRLPKLDDLAVMHIIIEKLAVARLVVREIGVVCGRDGVRKRILGSSVKKQLTFEDANHIHKHIVS